MTDTEHERTLPIDHVFHPTDLSHASEIALAHALRVALAGWGLLPPGSPKHAVPALGIEVERVVAHGKDPLRASLD
jgi:hypothetical protein